MESDESDFELVEVDESDEESLDEKVDEEMIIPDPLSQFITFQGVRYIVLVSGFSEAPSFSDLQSQFGEDISPLRIRIFDEGDICEVFIGCNTFSEASEAMEGGDEEGGVDCQFSSFFELEERLAREGSHPHRPDAHYKGVIKIENVPNAYSSFQEACESLLSQLGVSLPSHSSFVSIPSSSTLFITLSSPTLADLLLSAIASATSAREDDLEEWILPLQVSPSCKAEMYHQVNSHTSAELLPGSVRWDALNADQAIIKFEIKRSDFEDGLFVERVGEVCLEIGISQLMSKSLIVFSCDWKRFRMAHNKLWSGFIFAPSEDWVTQLLKHDFGRVRGVNRLSNKAWCTEIVQTTMAQVVKEMGPSALLMRSPAAVEQKVLRVSGHWAACSAERLRRCFGGYELSEEDVWIDPSNNSTCYVQFQSEIEAKVAFDQVSEDSKTRTISCTRDRRYIILNAVSFSLCSLASIFLSYSLGGEEEEADFPCTTLTVRRPKERKGLSAITDIVRRRLGDKINLLGMEETGRGRVAVSVGTIWDIIKLYSLPNMRNSDTSLSISPSEEKLPYNYEDFVSWREVEDFEEEGDKGGSSNPNQKGGRIVKRVINETSSPTGNKNKKARK